MGILKRIISSNHSPHLDTFQILGTPDHLKFNAPGARIGARAYLQLGYKTFEGVADILWSRHLCAIMARTEFQRKSSRREASTTAPSILSSHSQ